MEDITKQLMGTALATMYINNNINNVKDELARSRRESQINSDRISRSNREVAEAQRASANATYQLAEAQREIARQEEHTRASTLDAVSDLKTNTLTAVRNSTNSIVGTMNTLQDEFSWRMSEQIDKQRIGNINTQNIAELMRIPDEEKVRYQAIKDGFKHYSNAKNGEFEFLYKDALRELIKAENIEPTDYIVLHRIGMIYLYSKSLFDPEKAVDYFMRAGQYASVESLPESESLIDILSGDITKLLKGERSKHSIKTIAANSYYQAGITHAIMTNIDEAISVTEKALSLDGSLNEALFNLAKFNSINGSIKNSVEVLEQLVEKDEQYLIRASNDDNLIENEEIVEWIKKYSITVIEKANSEYVQTEEKYISIQDIDDETPLDRHFMALKEYYNNTDIDSYFTAKELLIKINALHKYFSEEVDLNREKESQKKEQENIQLEIIQHQEIQNKNKIQRINERIGLLVSYHFKSVMASEQVKELFAMLIDNIETAHLVEKFLEQTHKYDILGGNLVIPLTLEEFYKQESRLHNQYEAIIHKLEHENNRFSKRKDKSAGAIDYTKMLKREFSNLTELSEKIHGGEVNKSIKEITDIIVILIKELESSLQDDYDKLNEKLIIGLKYRDEVVKSSDNLKKGSDWLFTEFRIQNNELKTSVNKLYKDVLKLKDEKYLLSHASIQGVRYNINTKSLIITLILALAAIYGGYYIIGEQGYISDYIESDVTLILLKYSPLLVASTICFIFFYWFIGNNGRREKYIVLSISLIISALSQLLVTSISSPSFEDRVMWAKSIHLNEIILSEGMSNSDEVFISNNYSELMNESPYISLASMYNAKALKTLLKEGGDANELWVDSPYLPSFMNVISGALTGKPALLLSIVRKKFEAANILIENGAIIRYLILLKVSAIDDDTAKYILGINNIAKEYPLFVGEIYAQSNLSIYNKDKAHKLLEEALLLSEHSNDAAIQIILLDMDMPTNTNIYELDGPVASEGVYNKIKNDYVNVSKNMNVADDVKRKIIEFISEFENKGNSIVSKLDELSLKGDVDGVVQQLKLYNDHFSISGSQKNNDNYLKEVNKNRISLINEKRVKEKIETDKREKYLSMIRENNKKRYSSIIDEIENIYKYAEVSNKANDCGGVHNAMRKMQDINVKYSNESSDINNNILASIEKIKPLRYSCYGVILEKIIIPKDMGIFGVCITKNFKYVILRADRLFSRNDDYYAVPTNVMKQVDAKKYLLSRDNPVVDGVDISHYSESFGYEGYYATDRDQYGAMMIGQTMEPLKLFLTGGSVLSRERFHDMVFSFSIRDQ